MDRARSRFTGCFLFLAFAALGACRNEPVEDAPALDAAVEDVDGSTVDAASDTTSDAHEEVGDTSVDDTLVDEAGDADAHLEDTLEDAEEAGADAALDADAACVPGDGATCTVTRVRVVAANLTSGTLQSYLDPGIRILKGLRPDVALVQEFNYAGGHRAFVDAAFGPEFHYATEPGLGQIPNAIVSRYPIVASGEWDDPEVDNRDFAWARIDVPGPIDLWAISVHLLTSSASKRVAEANALVAYVKAHVPAGDFVVIGGDFNTDTATEPVFGTLGAVVLSTPPYAADHLGNTGTNASRSKPYDWVLPSPSLLARMIPVQIGASAFPAGLVVDTRVYDPLADIAPALASDSAAPSMQHMAVVRDFALAD